MSPGRDIVDTEPSDGDVYQMLLGSISDDHDHRNDPPIASGEISPPAVSEAYPSPLSNSPTTPNTLRQRLSHHRGISNGSGYGIPPYAGSTPAVVRTSHE
jgi:hypothetical protein